MPNLVDFIERATTGPLLAEETFNLKVLIPNVTRIVQAYGIRYDPEAPVCADDDVADRLFAAAVEFVAQTGVYCDATNRVIGVDRAEIAAAVENFSPASAFGEGRDRRTFSPRQPLPGMLRRRHRQARRRLPAALW